MKWQTVLLNVGIPLESPLPCTRWPDRWAGCPEKHLLNWPDLDVLESYNKRKGGWGKGTDITEAWQWEWRETYVMTEASAKNCCVACTLLISFNILMATFCPLYSPNHTSRWRDITREVKEARRQTTREVKEAGNAQGKQYSLSTRFMLAFGQIV